MRKATLLLLCLHVVTAAEDRAISAKASLDTAQANYRSQVLGDLDHPIGDSIVVLGKSIPVRHGTKGELELDSVGNGKFTSYAKSQVVQVVTELTEEDGKPAKTVKLYLFLDRHPEAAWTYRNASQLTIVLGKERLAIVDVNGDGAFNSPGIDGMTWAGHEWLFPLPAPSERFCTDSLNLALLSMGKTGDRLVLQGRPLSTTLASTLPILTSVNQERIRLGLTPRPEDAALSVDLQKHCVYMNLNHKISHPEEASKPGYSPEGHAAGLRSILSYSTPAEQIAAMMVATYFHRQDVIRPNTLAFGLGIDGGFGGIDGRTTLASVNGFRWPVLCPVPDQTKVPLAYYKETPDATPGDAHAGFPLTAYFGRGKPTLVSHQLVAANAPKAPIACYTFDHKTGASPEFSGFQNCVCLIPKEALKPATLYSVAMAVDHEGKRWERAWCFTTTNEQ
jgi:hypothetical protein